MTLLKLWAAAANSTFTVSPNTLLQKLCPVDFFFTSVSPVAGQSLNFPARNPFHLNLREAFLNCMPVVFVSERFYTRDNTRTRTDNGDLVSKLILLMFHAFADALCFRFMREINSSTPQYCKKRADQRLPTYTAFSESSR